MATETEKGDMSRRHNHARFAPGYWLPKLLAAIMLIFGIPILLGGVWLITLGGSWYYAIAGLGLCASAVLIFRGTMLGVWVYLATWIFTLVWAFWEVGLDGWAQVPRLVAPTVILVLVLACIPVLSSGHRHKVRFAPVAAAFLALMGFGAASYVHVEPTSAIAQEAAEDSETTPAPTSESDPEIVDLDATPTANDARSMTASAEPDEPQYSPTALPAIGADWPAYGGDRSSQRYSPLGAITPDNVSGLERVWEYHSGDMPSAEAEGKYSPENTPLKIGDDLYHCTAMGEVVSIDAATGREEWHYDPEVPDDAIPYGATCRGVAYFAVPDAAEDELCATRIIWGTLDARLIAVDARLGQPCADFGENGEIYLEEGLGDTVPGWYAVTAPPTIVQGVVVTGAQVKDGQAEDSPSGVIRGYDAITGALVWAWDLGNPSITTAPPEGETYTRGTPNMWTMAVGDEERGLVYLPLGNSAVDYYGSNRSEAENEYATSLVALDARTGEEAWHFQTVRHDVWDYDLGSQPSLVEFPTDNGTVPAIILSSKQGEIYVLNRETGDPLFPVEDREVPTNLGVEQDFLAKTQPFSTYHSLVKPPLEEKDMWGMTPLDQLWCRIQFKQANYEGIYTPPTTDGHWIQYPGYNGGQDWGSMALDPENGILIANYNDMPNYNRLIPREEADEMGVKAIFEPDYAPGGSEAGPQLGSPYAISVNAGWRESFTGLMCKEPPYGWIRAIDLKTGETLWDTPLGTASANGPFGIPSMMPMTIGTPNNGGPLVTAGGLIFIAATTDNLIRAIDMRTGETVWQDTLPGGGQTTPISYEVGGRQFIALAPGGHHFMETPISDAVIAWALPE